MIATLIDLIISVTYGLISGFSGGKVDTIMQRIIEVIFIPNLVIVTMLGFVIGKRCNIHYYFNCYRWLDIWARQVRNLTLSLQGRDFVLASRALGESKLKNCI